MIVKLKKLNDSLRQTEQIYMVMVALVIGLLGGFSAIGIRLLIRAVNSLSWHRGAYTIEYIAALPFWWKLLAPAIGGLFVGFIVHYIASEAKGHGVPEVMEAIALRAGRMRPRVVAAKLLASGICIGSGGSVGREGPIVQIGAAIGSTVGQWLRIDQRRMRTLVGCGAAAGIAAAFNAPVAGALFAVEIILGDFGVAQFSPIVVSSVAATVVSHHFLGNFPAFRVPPYRLVHPSELIAYAGLGIAAAFVALLFIRVLYALEDGFDKLPVYPPAKAVVGGLLIGAMGIFAPHIFGVGYEAINEALTGQIIWPFMVALVVLKIAAVGITIGSGGSGGIFAPSLFIGAMLGGAVGTVVDHVWPAATGGTGAYALVGMGAVVAAATHAPITAILIIFELTGDYAIILPLMISCIIATLLAVRMERGSIYTLKLLRRGLDVHRGKAVNVLQHVSVRELMRTDMVTVSPDAGMVELLSTFIEHPGDTLFVTDPDHRLRGLVTAAQIRPVMSDPNTLEGLVIAEDVMAHDGYPRVSPDRSIAEVMRFLEEYRGEVPVVEDDRLVGTIWPEDVIERYNEEVFKRDMAGSMASAVGSEPLAPVPALHDTVVGEVLVPAAFAGRTISELRIRQHYGVSVLVIKRLDERGREQIRAITGPDTRLNDGDIMLVLG
ncbi:MAG: chloride channel protein, partial [Gemmatimonadota bacterium]